MQILYSSPASSQYLPAIQELLLDDNNSSDGHFDEVQIESVSCYQDQHRFRTQLHGIVKPTEDLWFLLSWNLSFYLTVSLNTSRLTFNPVQKIGELLFCVLEFFPWDATRVPTNKGCVFIFTWDRVPGRHNFVPKGDKCVHIFTFCSRKLMIRVFQH